MYFCFKFYTNNLTVIGIYVQDIDYCTGNGVLHKHWGWIKTAALGKDTFKVWLRIIIENSL